MSKKEQAYMEYYKRTREALRKIDAMIHDLPAPEGDRELTWTDVGEMDRIASALESILPEA
jgi:hypothetical protein